ncbi:MAG: hydroxymethylglutaryl-CoA lyase [Fimbriimonadaceae bacterium]|nr:hydroxymethylglutaryl-CoA lyase [Fimbriimonadaceae bacterium]
MTDKITLVEVGPRDGLQNEKIQVQTHIKANFVNQLSQAGLGEIEVTSFVSPKWVPQLADAAELLELVEKSAGTHWVLVPNANGLDLALANSVSHIALFTAASSGFTQKNINMSVEESLVSFRDLVRVFREKCPQGRVRSYVSTIVECPFSGSVRPSDVASVVRELLEMGVDEVSLGETIGVATPQELLAVAEEVEKVAPKEKLAWHLHDTRGTAVAGVYELIKRGYRKFDSSAGGLGGCPYAPGAGGNVATEDLIYLTDRLGIPSGVSLLEVAQASLPVLESLGRRPTAKSQLAVLAACNLI